VLYAHSKFLCSLASFKLSSLGVRHPSRTPLLNCYSTRHSRRADLQLCTCELRWRSIRFYSHLL